MNKIIWKNESFEDARNCKKTARQRNRQFQGAGRDERAREGGRDGRERANVRRREREEGD